MSSRSSAEILENLKGSTLAITGASGFVGTSILEELNRRVPKNHIGRVLCVSRSEPDRGRYSSLKNIDIEWVQQDVELGLHQVPSAEFMIHAATPSSANVQKADPLALVHGMIRGVASVIDWARMCSTPPRVLFTSSGAVYGHLNSRHSNFKESEPGILESYAAGNAYAEAKRLCETMILLSGDDGILDPVCARLFSFVGPHLPMNGHFAIGNFIGSAIRGKPVLIRGTGTPRRSYLYESDMASWILRALTMKERIDHPLNIGSSSGFALSEVGAAVARLAGVELVIEGDEELDGARLDYVPDTQKTESALKVWQSMSLEQAIEKTIGGYASA